MIPRTGQSPLKPSHSCEVGRVRTHLGVPDTRTLCALKDDGQRVVAVGVQWEESAPGSCKCRCCEA